MKTILSLIISLLFTLNSFCTEQVPDLLIIDKDTIYLKSFPINQLNFKKSPNPFAYEDDPLILSTNCWRGYQAIWRLVDNKLILEEVRACNSDDVLEYEKVLAFFERNDYEVELIDGKVHASWYTADMVSYRYMSKNYVCVREPYKGEKAKVVLRFEKGEMALNELK